MRTTLLALALLPRLRRGGGLHPPLGSVVTAIAANGFLAAADALDVDFR